MVFAKLVLVGPIEDDSGLGVGSRNKNKMITEPKKIQITDNGLVIDWDDEHRSLYPYKALRGECRCANCIDEWSGRRILDTSSIPIDIQIVDFIEVGRYAIQILWSDAHETGIYSFELLGSICKCDRCLGEKSD